MISEFRGIADGRLKPGSLSHKRPFLTQFHEVSIIPKRPWMRCTKRLYVTCVTMPMMRVWVMRVLVHDWIVYMPMGMRFIS